MTAASSLVKQAFHAAVSAAEVNTVKRRSASCVLAIHVLADPVSTFPE